MTSVHSSRDEVHRLLEDLDKASNMITSELAFTSTVTTKSVLMKLSKLNPTNANGHVGISAWLLKENAELFAHPIKEILNSSYREGHLPRT